MRVSDRGCLQLQLGGEAVWKTWTIGIFHYLPHAPSTAAVLPSPVLGHPLPALHLPPIPSQHRRHETCWFC